MIYTVKYIHGNIVKNQDNLNELRSSLYYRNERKTQGRYDLKINKIYWRSHTIKYKLNFIIKHSKNIL